MSNRRPPKKQHGRATGPRRLDGFVKDVAASALFLGETEKTTRSQIARGLLPHRKLGGRIVCLTDELTDYLRRLPGVTVETALANVAARNGRQP